MTLPALGSKLEGDGNWHGGNQGDMCVSRNSYCYFRGHSDIFKINLLIKKDYVLSIDKMKTRAL